jgi:hypothetical protein
MNSDFLNVLQSHCMTAPKREVVAGKFSRWGDDNQFWATAIADGYVFGSWQPPFLKSSWFPNTAHTLTKVEQKKRKLMIKKAFAEEGKIRLEEQLTAATQANAEYQNYSSDCTNSQYLKRKQVDALGVKY